MAVGVPDDLLLEKSSKIGMFGPALFKQMCIDAGFDFVEPGAGADQFGIDGYVNAGPLSVPVQIKTTEQDKFQKLGVAFPIKADFKEKVKKGELPIKYVVAVIDRSQTIWASNGVNCTTVHARIHWIEVGPGESRTSFGLTDSNRITSDVLHSWFSNEMAVV